MGSVKSRKVSTQSLQSATSTEETPSSYAIFEENEAAANVADVVTEPQDFADTDDQDYSRSMSWIRVRVIKLLHGIDIG